MDDLSLALNNSGIGGYLGNAFLVTHITLCWRPHHTAHLHQDETKHNDQFS